MENPLKNWERKNAKNSRSALKFLKLIKGCNLRKLNSCFYVAVAKARKKSDSRARAFSSAQLVWAWQIM